MISTYSQSLEDRIEQLEFLLCHGQHNYVDTSIDPSAIDDDGKRLHYQTCAICGRKHREYK